MQVSALVTAARNFVENLPSTPYGLNTAIGVVKEDAGPFNKIFRQKDEFVHGVYWFFRPTDGYVFDVGKSETSVWARIYAQTGKPILKSLPQPENETGENWGFTESAFLRYNADKLQAETKTAIEDGTFHVGWMSISPPYAAKLVEVYLHTLCLAKDGKLPELNFTIG